MALPKAKKEELSARAVELHVKGYNFSEIGRQIEVDRRTAKKWVDDELARRSEHRTHDKEKAIATYEAVIAEAWARLEKLDNRSLNVSGLLNSIRSAQDSINKITGAEAPQKYQKVEDEYEVVWDDADSFAE